MSLHEPCHKTLDEGTAKQDLMLAVETMSITKLNTFLSLKIYAIPQDLFEHGMYGLKASSALTARFGFVAF